MQKEIFMNDGERCVDLHLVSNDDCIILNINVYYRSLALHMTTILWYKPA